MYLQWYCQPRLSKKIKLKRRTPSNRLQMKLSNAIGENVNGDDAIDVDDNDAKLTKSTDASTREPQLKGIKQKQKEATETSGRINTKIQVLSKINKQKNQTPPDARVLQLKDQLIQAKDASKHVFHIFTDRLNYAAMGMWILVNPPGKATIQVQNFEDFTWLNTSYSPVLKQLASPAMMDYYFKVHRATSDSNLKFRNPKYLSILNHLRFYLPKIFPKLNKVLFLDDDIVVQRRIWKH